MRKLQTAQRLIVAADFKPEGERGYEETLDRLMNLARSLEGTGVVIKLNSLLRAFGYPLIMRMHDLGLEVFADLKLIDIDNTLSNDGAFLRYYSPDLLTAMCVTGVKALRALQAELPSTEILGVTVLTSLLSSEVKTMFACSTEEAALRVASIAKDAVLGGLISSPAEVEVLKAEFGVMFSYNTPAIRPAFSIVPGDDQNPDRIMTAAKAIAAGADRIVVGRPITQAKDPRDAVMRTLDEIESALG